MTRFSLTSRCAICGKEVAQSGPARQWVHLNEFYAKADHPAEPKGGQPYVMPKRTASPAPEKAEPRGNTTPAADTNKPRTVAELRRRLMQGSTEISADDSASRRRRIVAMDTGEAQAGAPEADLAVKRLRMLRMQAQAPTDEPKR